jgi:hypothetical protein
MGLRAAARSVFVPITIDSWLIGRDRLVPLF